MNGKVDGRKGRSGRKRDMNRVREMERLRKEGWTWEKIGKLYKISRQGASQAVKRAS